MKIYLSGTANLGDFLNGMPVMSGISKSYVKYDLIIKKEMRCRGIPFWFKTFYNDLVIFTDFKLFSTLYDDIDIHALCFDCIKLR